MKKVIYLVILLAASCSYKSESQKSFDETLMLADCTAISTNKSLINIVEIGNEAIKSKVKLKGIISKEDSIQIDSNEMKIRKYKNEIDTLEKRISERLANQ
jgi:hypothetical protein